MGRQSSRIYFNGHDHKDIYFQGHYHDAVFMTDGEGNATLVWEKIKGVPLEGFTAICYYNEYFYVAYWNRESLSKSVVNLYQGEQLDKLEHAYTIEKKGAVFNLFHADEYGVILVYFSESSTSSSMLLFGYLENKKLELKQSPYNGYTIDNPINIAYNTSLRFLYRKSSQSLTTTPAYMLTTYYNSFTRIQVSGNGGTSGAYDETHNPDTFYDANAVFAYDNNVVFPIQPTGYTSFTLADTNYFLVDTYALESVDIETKKIEIPQYIIDFLYDEIYQEYKKRYQNPYATITREKIKFTYNLRDGVVISNGYLIFQDASIIAKEGSSSAYAIRIEHSAEIRIDLKNFSITAFNIKDYVAKQNVSKFITDEYSLILFQMQTQTETGSEMRRFIRYIFAPEYNSAIDIRNIKNINILGSSESDIENNLRFVATYRTGNYLYYSILNLDNYLLEINMKNNTAAIIRPALYLKEGL